MGTTTRVTTATGSGVSTHDISFAGLAGTIFWLVIVSIIIYLIGFVTPSWQSIDNGGTLKVGLWDTCECGKDAPWTSKDFFKATQAMICIGLIFQVLAAIVLLIYMCIHKISKNLILMVFVVLCFTAVLFMVIGFIVFGVETEKTDHGGGNLSYSFVLCVVGACVCCAAGVAGLVQMRKSRAR